MCTCYVIVALKTGGFARASRVRVSPSPPKHSLFRTAAASLAIQVALSESSRFGSLPTQGIRSREPPAGGACRLQRGFSLPARPDRTCVGRHDGAASRDKARARTSGSLTMHPRPPTIASFACARTLNSSPLPSDCTDILQRSRCDVGASVCARSDRTTPGITRTGEGCLARGPLGSYWPHRASIRPWTISRTTSMGLRSAALWRSPLSSCHPWRWTGTSAGAIGAPPMAAQSQVTWGTGQNGLILRWRASR
jgi:hypothetical protein